jgi:hypothetical protein
MAEESPRNPYNCLMGGPAHPAYIQPNIGANVYWCPKHGIIMSMSGCFVTREDEASAKKHMTDEQWDRFLARRKARARRLAEKRKR